MASARDDLEPEDTNYSFEAVLVVSAIALAAPLLVDMAPRLRVPAVVLEIGLAFLLLLAGPEIDSERLRHGIGHILGAFAISLGLVVPVLHDAGETDSEFGQFVLAASSVAEFGTILILSISFPAKSTTTGSKVLPLVAFVLLVLIVAYALIRAGESNRASAVLARLRDTSAQIGVRLAMALLILFVALASSLGLEAILGTFVAGALLRFVDPRHRLTDHRFRAKMEAIGYGFLVPVFFITSGIRLDMNALFHDAHHVVLVPLFALSILVARGLPGLLYRGFFSNRRVVAAGLLQATSLTFIVIASRLGVELDVFDSGTGAALVAAGVITVILFPSLALAIVGDTETVPDWDDLTGGTTDTAR